MNATGTEQWNWDDGSGQRVMQRTSVGGTASSTVCAFGLEEHQYNASGTNTGNTSYYSVGGHLIGEQTGTSTKTTTFLLTDLLGSVVASFSNTSGSAAVQGNRAYSPYGAPLYQQGSVGTSRGFTGQYADSTSGLDYYNARSYDPLVGQFVSADSVQGNLVGMNPYAYVGGNPETWTDPTGLVATGACGVACTGKSSTSPAGSYDLGAGPCGLSVFGICILPETPPQVSRCDADPESCLPPESIGPEPSPTPVVDTPPPLPPWIVDQWPTLPPLETPPPPDEGSVMGRILAMNEGEAQGDTGNMEEGGTVPQEQPPEGQLQETSYPQQAQQRAEEIRNQIVQKYGWWFRREATVGVAYMVDEEGNVSIVVAQNESTLGKWQDKIRQILNPDEQWVDNSIAGGSRHAEELLVDYAKARGYRIIGIGASTGFCGPEKRNCRAMLLQEV